MSELKEVEQSTPILDAIEAKSPIGKVVAVVLRKARGWLRRRREARKQEYVDKHWHDPKVGEKDE